jgi:hypothetical protein
MLLTIPILAGLLGALLFWMAASPPRILYLLPVLLAFEYRVRLSSFSFDLAELGVLIVSLAWFVRVSNGQPERGVQELPSQWTLVALLAIFAFPAIFFEYKTLHALSVYRDLLVPFLFVSIFLHAGLDKEHVRTLIRLACVLAVANACLGIVQYTTGNYLWLAGPDEAEWQAYKTGLARLSIFGDFLGVQDTLPVGLYTGANNFACFLSLPLCLTTTLAFSRQLSVWQRLACSLASLLMFVCLLFTIFRSGLLVYVTSMMVVYLLLSPRRSGTRVAVVLALAGLAAILFFTQGLFDWDGFGSFEGRQEMIADAFALMKSHPELLLTGGYTDLYHLLSKQTQEIHNLALYSIVQFGLPATALFFAYFIRFFRRAMRAVRSAAGIERNVLVAVVVSIAANVFVYGSTTMLIDSVQTSIWLLFWVGVATYLMAFQKDKSEERSGAQVTSSVIAPAQGEFA